MTSTPAHPPAAHADDRAAIADAVDRLTAADHPRDWFGTTVPARRILGVIPQRQKYRKAGTGWRLGVVAVSADGTLHAVGRIVRATRQVLPGHQAESARERRALKETLVDDGFPEGATVLLDAPHIPIEGGSAGDSDVPAPPPGGPVVVRDGRVFVRWMPGAPDSALTPLPAYLAERVALALTPADPALTAESSPDSQETQ